MRRFAVAVSFAAAAASTSAAAQNNCTYPSSTCSSARFFAHQGGSASAPAVTLTGDRNTGLYWSGSDVLGFATGGLSRLRILSSGDLQLDESDNDQSIFGPPGGFGKLRFSNAVGSTLCWSTSCLEVNSDGVSLNMSGTPVHPALTFSQDAAQDTGLYRIDENQLGIAVGGARAFAFVGPGSLAGQDSTSALLLQTNLARLDGAGSTVSCTPSTCTATNASAAQPGFVVKMAAGQTGEAQTWQDNAGTKQAVLTKTGGLALSLGTDESLTNLRTATAPLEALYGSGLWLRNAFQPHFGATRRWGGVSQTNPSDSTLVAFGPMVAPTVLGTAAASSADSARMMVSYTTAAVANDLAGWSGSYAQTRPSYGPSYAVSVRTHSDITSTRIWVGWTNAALTADTNNSNHLCAFRYSTAAGDTNWQACRSNGTAQACTDTTVAVAASTTYELAIDGQVSGRCSFYVNGVLRATTTSGSTSSAVTVGPQTTVETLAAAARAIHIGSAMLEQNN